MSFHIIRHFFDIHTHSSQTGWSIRNITFPQEDETIMQEDKWYSVGWHPWYLDEKLQEISLEKIGVLAQKRNIIAIGETGLDRKIAAEFSFQKQIFEEHVRLSEALQKPLIIHCVRAYSDLLELHKKLKPAQIWILHGFQGHLETAQALQRKGIYLSFGEALIKNSKFEQVLPQLDLEKVLLETDISLISIEIIYEKAAKILEIESDYLQKFIKKNLCNIFLEKYLI